MESQNNAKQLGGQCGGRSSLHRPQTLLTVGVCRLQPGASAPDTTLDSRLFPGLPRGYSGKETTCLPMQETQEAWVQSLGQEDPLEKEIAT